jgi:hypothetical protein
MYVSHDMHFSSKILRDVQRIHKTCIYQLYLHQLYVTIRVVRLHITSHANMYVTVFEYGEFEYSEFAYGEFAYSEFAYGEFEYANSITQEQADRGFLEKFCQKRAAYTW